MPYRRSNSSTASGSRPGSRARCRIPKDIALTTVSRPDGFVDQLIDQLANLFFHGTHRLGRERQGQGLTVNRVPRRVHVDRNHEAALLSAYGLLAAGKQLRVASDV